MISKIVLDNFAAFGHFEFDLVENKTDKKAKQLAIVYGENGIGKTSLVRAVEFLKRTYIALVATEEMAKILGNFEKQEFLINILKNSLADFRIDSIIKKRRRIGTNKELTQLQFEIILEKKKYVYDISLDNYGINEEKLLCNGLLVFKATKKSLLVKDEFFLSDDIKEKLNSSFAMYFGDKYSFLSCIAFLRRSLSASFFDKAVSKELLLFMKELDDLVVVTRETFNMEAQDFGVNNKSNDFLPNYFRGQYSDKLNSKKENTELALSMFFSSLYSNIRGVKYRIDADNNGNQSYTLCFVESKNDETALVPYDFESTGTKKLVFLFNNFYQIATKDSVVFIDEIDEGINDILLRDIFNSLDESIKGQLVVTTHNTLLLKHSIKKNIYLLDRGNDNEVCSYSLDEFGRKIQSGTDIIGQYLDGLYGGVPQSGSFSIKYIVEALNNNE